MHKPLELDLPDTGIIHWFMFSEALEKLAGPIDDDIMETVADLLNQPGGCYEIGRLLEVDPALVLLAHGLSEGLASALLYFLED